MTTLHRSTFCNPFWSQNFPDPFVLKVRGRYYAYGTEREMFPAAGTDVFPILTSTDMVNWTYVGKAMKALGQPYGRYWAPEVTMHNGQFLLYYAVHTDEFTGAIRVAVADKPEGPFVDSGHDLTSRYVPWAIDPHVFRDVDGQWYLYMTVEYWHDTEGFTGSGNVVDRLVDPFTLQGRLTRVTPPRQSWELFQAKRSERGGVDWYTVEGPAVVRHRNTYYEMFSGGCYYRDNYAVSFSTAIQPMGPDGMQDSSWSDWEGRDGSPLLLKGNPEHALSPGHNSLVMGPNNVDMYLAYHVLQPDMKQRYPFLDRLFWHGDEPWTPAPTWTPQPRPVMPRLRELFPLSSLDSSWQQEGGQWTVTDGAVTQQEEDTVYALLQQEAALSTDWLLEVNLRAETTPGRYGVLLRAEDTAVVSIALDASSLTIAAGHDGLVQVLPLADDFVATGWHQLLISLSGTLLRVQIDGMQTVETVIATIPEQFALYTEHCRASFSGISLTDAFRDEFLSSQYSVLVAGWRGVTGQAALENWQCDNGTLIQGCTEGRQILLKGLELDCYEVGATMKLLQHGDGNQAQVGVVVCTQKEGRIVAGLVHDGDMWSLQVRDEEIGKSYQSVRLPATFNVLKWHTVRAVYRQGEICVWLDGEEMMQVVVPSGSGRVGVLTCTCSAAFTGVWMTGIPLEQVH